MLRVMKNLSAALVLSMSLYIFCASPMYAYIADYRQSSIERGRMANVTLAATPTPDAVAMPAPAPSAVPESPAAVDSQTAAAPLDAFIPLPGDKVEAYAADSAAEAELIPALAVTVTEQGEEQVVETTIEGGLAIKNQTGYQADVGKLLMQGPGLSFEPGKPQILVIHTHSSEAYTPAGLDKYEASDNSRTEDLNYNIIRVGDELCSILQSAGLEVIHDRGIYDYPSYTGSYTRSGEAVENWLTEYPSIRMVIDVHRDALGNNGIVYKTMAEEEGVCASQVMMVVGTDESGLAHSGWRDNLALAVYLQRAVTSAHPTLMRPILLVPQRYNQHLTSGSLILEVGSSGNTLQEALAAVRLFADSAGPALSALVTAPEESAE